MKYWCEVIFSIYCAFPYTGQAQHSPSLQDSQKIFIQSLQKSLPMTFESNSLQSGFGAVVRLNYQKGMDALVARAKIDEHETSWIFLPQFELWINTAEKVFEAQVKQNTKILEFALDHTKNVEFWHTHVDSEYNNGYYTKDQIKEFGPSLYFIPTGPDVCSLMFNATLNPNNNITSSIASSQGILHMMSPPLEWDFSNIYTQKAFNDYCLTEFNWIREHFRGSPAPECKDRAKSYNSTLKLSFIVSN